MGARAFLKVGALVYRLPSWLVLKPLLWLGLLACAVILVRRQVGGIDALVVVVGRAVAGAPVWTGAAAARMMVAALGSSV
jgi:hypothetical protein